MEKHLVACAVALLAAFPVAAAASVQVTGGNSTHFGSSEIPTEFGMVTGSILFRLGNFSWVPSEIWLLSQDVDPDVFSKGLTQQEVIEMPNVTFSACRTAVYSNKTSGAGFKVYNTGTTTQIFPNGTFCGLAYPGTYFVFARY